MPIMVFHGTDDNDVPIDTSDELAHTRPDLVTLHRIKEAGHMESWNVDAGFYESTIIEFTAHLDR